LVVVEIQAGPKGALTAVPQTIGHTAEDKVTFRDRRLGDPSVGVDGNDIYRC